MAECEVLAGCPFYNDKMDSEQGLGAMYKKKYCLGDNTDCARHMVFRKLGKGRVPADLFPNSVEQARKSWQRADETGDSPGFSFQKMNRGNPYR